MKMRIKLESHISGRICLSDVCKTKTNLIPLNTTWFKVFSFWFSELGWKRVHNYCKIKQSDHISSIHRSMSTHVIYTWLPTLVIRDESITQNFSAKILNVLLNHTLALLYPHTLTKSLSCHQNNWIIILLTLHISRKSWT